MSNPLFAVYCNVYTGVYKHRKFTYAGDEDHLLWEEYGIKLHFPPCASEVHIEGTVSVLSVDDDNYKFPEGYELVSAVYNVSANKPFPYPVTIQLQHCVPLHNDDDASHLGMSFMIADTEQGPPYVFRELCGGVFRCGSSYGEIQLSHFSILAIFWWYLGYPIPFSGSIYHFEDNTASIVVTQNLAAHISVSIYTLSCNQCILLHKPSSAGC